MISNHPLTPVLGVILLVIAIWLLFKYSRKCKEEPFDDLSAPDESIFISIASYRDARCSVTVDDLYEKAAKPDRVFVGICQQNADEGDKDCMFSTATDKYRSNIRTVRMSHLDARGPTYARYLCSTLWQGETYFLQIDSHTKFAEHWDEKLVNMIKALKETGVKKPLLSHYPPNYEDVQLGEQDSVTTICKSFFNDRSMISFEGAQFQKRQALPQPNAYVAGGMFFAESTFLKEVPFDPDLPYLFVGEEILHSARFWTNGWDIFTPSESVVFHYYTREGEPKFWDHHKGSEDAAAHSKVQHLLKLSKSTAPPYVTKNLERYGLGTERSLDDYYKYCGIDLKKKKVNKSFCT